MSSSSTTSNSNIDYTERRTAWIRTRRIGFASFLIPISIIIVQLGTSNERVQSAIRSLDSSAVWRTVVYFVIWACIEVVLNAFKYLLCTKGFGMSWKHYRLIVARRDAWTNKEVEMLEKEYGSLHLKQMDALYRRAGHIVVNLFRLVYYLSVCQQQEERLQVALLQLPVIFTLKLATEKNSVGDFVFQGCRIRDGQYGRFNQVVVNFWAYCSRIIIHAALLERGYAEESSRVLIVLSVQGLIWGDTFGEVIGSFFGRREFKVLGIGEVNMKTVEGTVAVFVSSFLSTLLVYRLLVPTGVEMFLFGHVTTFLYHALVMMFVETAAPRSTDNFFLQTCGLFVLIASCKNEISFSGQL